MKRINGHLLLFFIGILMSGSVPSWAQGVVIHCWNFNDGSSGGSWSSPIPTTARIVGDGSIIHNFVEIDACGGDVSNSCTGSSAGMAFCPKGKDENGNSFTLLFSTEGYENIVLSFWCLRSSPGNSDHGFKNNIIEYSTNGGDTWTSVTVFVPSESGGIVQSDFTDIPASNDNEQFQIKVTLDGATNPNGANSYDNIKLEGTPIQLALPVDLLTFSVSQKSDHVLLDWTFDNAHELDRFEVEHATDQKGWQSIGMVMYNAELSRNKQAQHIHRQPLPGNNYYRLRMIDLDGSQEISRIEAINIPKRAGARPVNTQVGSYLIVERLSSSEHKTFITLTDLQGRMLYNSFLPAEVVEVSIDMSLYSSGLYVLQTVTGGDVEIFKVVKE